MFQGLYIRVQQSTCNITEGLTDKLLPASSSTKCYCSSRMILNELPIVQLEFGKLTPLFAVIRIHINTRVEKKKHQNTMRMQDASSGLVNLSLSLLKVYIIMFRSLGNDFDQYIHLFSNQFFLSKKFDFCNFLNF